MRLTVGSLFSGIGGFDLGFERAGFEVRWQVEIDPQAREVLHRHWPHVPRFADVREVGGAELAPVDVIVFGSPCQDLSVAGRREGLKGARSGLFYEAIRIIRELRPTFAVWENVPGALSSNAGRDFANVLAAFSECGPVDLTWRTLNSEHFGVPQRRRRVFLVADFGGERSAEILLERDGSSRDIAPGQEARQGASASPAGIAGTVSSKWSKGTGGPAGDEAYNLIAFCGGAGSTKGSTMGEAVDLSPTIVGNQIPHVSGTLPASGSGLSRPGNTGSDVHLLVTPEYYSHDFNQDRIYSADGLAPTHTAQDSNKARNVHTGHGVRRLTPTECARLQGFPDSWNDWLSDAARYRQFGNAVTVNVAEWIARRMKAAVEPDKDEEQS